MVDEFLRHMNGQSSTLPHDITKLLHYMTDEQLHKYHNSFQDLSFRVGHQALYEW